MNLLDQISAAIRKDDRKTLDRLSQEQGFTALHIAAAFDTKESIQPLLHKGPNINAQDKHGKTPLHWAAFKGQKETIETLLENGADPSVKDKCGHLAINYAAHGGHVGIVESLFDKTPVHTSNLWHSVIKLYNSDSVKGIELAHFLCRKNSIDMDPNITVFLRDKIGKIAEYGHKQGYTSEALSNILNKFHIQASSEESMSLSRENLSIITYNLLFSLINAQDVNSNKLVTYYIKGVHLSFRDDYTFLFHKLLENLGWGSIHLAVAFSNKEAIENLMRQSINIEVTDRYGLTPLDVAMAQCHKEIVEYLLTFKIEIIRITHNRYKSLHIAAAKGLKDVVKFLVEQGENIDVTTTDEYTPLHCAVGGGHMDVVEHLVQHKADVNFTNTDGNTPFHDAITSNRKDIVEYLLQNGVDIKARNEDGWTPMYYAAFSGAKDVAELLVAKGADINTSANDSWTPLHKAVYEGHEGVVEVLLAAGADTNVKLHPGDTPLHLATATGRIKIVKILIDKMDDPYILDGEGLNALDIAIQSQEYLGEDITEIMVSFLSRYEGFLDLRKPPVRKYLKDHIDKIITNELNCNSSKAFYNILKVFNDAGEHDFCVDVVKKITNIVQQENFLPKVHQKSSQDIDSLSAHKAQLESLGELFVFIDKPPANKYVVELNQVFKATNQKRAEFIEADQKQRIDLTNKVIHSTKPLGYIADTPAIECVLSCLKDKDVTSLCLTRNSTKKNYEDHPSKRQAVEMVADFDPIEYFLGSLGDGHSDTEDPT